jgi:hypothetical protein
VLQLWLLYFFGEALPNTFLEKGFTKEALEGRIHFLYCGGVAKKIGNSGSSNYLGEAVCK